MDKEGNDYVDVKLKNKDAIGSIWIESEVMGFDQAFAELREILENKLIRIELLKWQNQLEKSKIQEGDSNFTRFLAEEIQKRFFDILKTGSTKVGKDKIET